jgi:hypothetical protein
MDQILDLRFDGKLPAEISSLFNTISYELRPKFNEIVTEISTPLKKNLDWWVQGPASRNTFNSPFFHYYCLLHLISKLIERNEFPFSRVLVDSAEFKSIVQSMLTDSDISDCSVHYNKLSIGKFIKRRFLMTPVLVAKKIIQQVLAKVSGRSNQKGLRVKPIVIIDTFMIADHTRNDRWYGQLWESLTDEVKQETYFVPTLVSTPISRMAQVYRELRNNVRNFIIREDFLTLSDIIYASQHQRRIKKIRIKPIHVLGYDLSKLIEEELSCGRDLLTIMESLLTYRFVQRLKNSGVEVRLAIDWFEGQVIDKAWNYGVNKFYPEAKTVGYRAFESFPFYLCSYPIPIEAESGVLPDVMAVQGRGTIATVREFLPDLEVIVIPSFKSQHVWECDFNQRKEDQGKKDQIDVLVTLPISLKTSKAILEQLSEASKLADSRNKRIVYTIKSHPTHSSENIKANLDVELSDSFVFTSEKSLPPLLHRSELLISEASSTCLEALACGIPVIVIENQEGLTFDPIPHSIPKAIVWKAGSVNQLVEAIEHYIHADLKKQKQLQLLGLEIRSDYFEPLSKEGINRFFDIENQESAKYA